MKAQLKERNTEEDGRHFEVFLSGQPIGKVIPGGRGQWFALARTGAPPPEDFYLLDTLPQRNAAARALEKTWKAAQKTRVQRKKKKVDSSSDLPVE